MKSIIILPLLIISSLLSNELAWVDEQINAIKPNRNGISNKNISKVKNPFIFLKKNSSKKTDKTKAITKTTATRSSNVESNISTSSTNSTASNIAKVTTPNSVLTLGAIINSSALINGKWFKVGNKVNKYKITNITNTSVTLVKNKKTTVISTKSGTSKLKFNK